MTVWRIIKFLNRHPLHPGPPLLDNRPHPHHKFCWSCTAASVFYSMLIIYTMGCVKSKHSDLTRGAKSARTADGGSGKGDRASLVLAEAGPEGGSPHVDPILLDYAQRLSEEIVARAVQQWAELDSRYSDIPYIECDVP